MRTDLSIKHEAYDNQEEDHFVFDDLHDALHCCSGVEMLTAVGTLEVVLSKKDSQPGEMMAACNNVIDLPGMHVAILQCGEVIFDDLRVDRGT